MMHGRDNAPYNILTPYNQPHPNHQQTSLTPPPAPIMLTTCIQEWNTHSPSAASASQAAATADGRIPSASSATPLCAMRGRKEGKKERGGPGLSRCSSSRL